MGKIAKKYGYFGNISKKIIFKSTKFFHIPFYQAFTF